MGLFRTSLLVVLSCAVMSVQAANWNSKKSSETSGDGKIPLYEESKIPVKSNFKLLTDLSQSKYKQCFTTDLGWTGKPIKDLSVFKLKYENFSASDYSAAFSDTSTGRLIDGKEVYSSFEDGLIRFTFDMQAQHHACLFNPSPRMCKKLIEIPTWLAQSSAASTYVNGMEKTDIPFTTIQKFMMPVLIAYSTAVQALGKPENHEDIGRWFASAISANVYDSKRGIAIDFWRSKNDLRRDNKKFGCFKAAHNHSLQSGFLVMAYGVVWNDAHSFNVGIDQLKTTLKSVREDGALACEVTRGPNSLFYSGATIHTMLQMVKLMSFQGIAPGSVTDLEPLHKAVTFQIEAGLNPDNLKIYTKRFKENTWCEPYKNASSQCIYQRPKRNAAFGWIQLYRDLFPDHRNSQKLGALVRKLVNEKIEDPRLKLNLNAMFQPNQLKTQLTLNYVDIIEPWEQGSSKDDDGMSHFNDTGDWSRGSPLCLYGLTDQTQLEVNNYPPEAKTLCSNALGQWKTGRTTGNWIEKVQALGLDQIRCQGLLQK